MDFISLNLLVVAIVTFALLATAAATAAATTAPGFPSRVSAPAEILETSFSGSKPIRIVVTVNSNRVDVLAADEKDVPKVLEKLRELCAGPVASLYPEICEHLGADGADGDLDLDGLDDIIWGSSKDPYPSPQMATPTNKGVDEAWSEPPSARPLSTWFAQETGSIEESQSSSSVVSESGLADTSTLFLATFTVPAEIKTIKTYQVVVHEVQETRLSATATVDDEVQTSAVAKSQATATVDDEAQTSAVAKSQATATIDDEAQTSAVAKSQATATVDDEAQTSAVAKSQATATVDNEAQTSAVAKPQVSTTLEIKIKSSFSEAVVHEVQETGLSATRATVDDEAQTSAVAKPQVPTTLETKIKSSSSESAPSKAENRSDKTMPITNPNNDSTSDKSEQDNKHAQVSTTIASSKSEKAMPAKKKTILITIVSVSTSTGTNHVSSFTVVSDGPETTLECPWKTGDKGHDDGPGPCTVVTIWHYSTITRPRGVTPDFTIGPSNTEFRPVFTPTASPRPSRRRTSFDISLPSRPSTDSDSPPLWFVTPKTGRTQIVSLVPKINDPFTSTMYLEIVTSTALISCSCPNLATEYIVQHGMKIKPRTTVTALEATTKKVVHCSASTAKPSGY